MANPFRTVRSIRRVRAFALAVLLLGTALSARAEMWELPHALALGKFPSFFSTRDGPVALWQESEIRGDVGRAWIRTAFFEGREWRSRRVSESPIEFHGVEPQLYTASISRAGTIAVATVDSGATFDIHLSRDSGRTFSKTGSVGAGGSATAPRIYESAKGGWILFAGRGRIVGSASEMAEGTLSIVIDCADSPDGAAWSRL
ncbi:MAG: hypothetical protein Q8M76_01995, partial [Spirochaetaceae bacterium]|nr:hypothetical protein [Spirochaetaceae bacterium]